MSYLLLQDGSKLRLQDGSGFVLLQDGATSVTGFIARGSGVSASSPAKPIASVSVPSKPTGSIQPPVMPTADVE